jgi:competence protein CoiA
MRFALIDNERHSPSPGLTGHYPGCGAAVIAKCGTERVHHWSHRSKRTCDPWWETETQWHRNWKDRFPQPWQEVIQHDASGEKHIADVRTDKGLVLEFQHSHLNPLEKASREKFHQNMVWVVDGLRLVRDLPRLIEGRRLLRKVGQASILPRLPGTFSRMAGSSVARPSSSTFRAHLTPAVSPET